MNESFTHINRILVVFLLSLSFPSHSFLPLQFFLLNGSLKCLLLVECLWFLGEWIRGSITLGFGVDLMSSPSLQSAFKFFDWGSISRALSSGRLMPLYYSPITPTYLVCFCFFFCKTGSIFKMIYLPYLPNIYQTVKCQRSWVEISGSSPKP